MFNLVNMLVFLTKVLTGAVGRWVGCNPTMKQRIYFANHTSNLDTIIIWACLPKDLRANTRPVAAKDYWNKDKIRRHIALKELNVVFVERNKETRTEDPLNPLRKALDEGFSLIIFPEGKRNDSPIPDEFKSGLFHLSQEYADVELIPVYLENVHKTFPRGAILPLPIICKAFFGSAFELISGEDKKTFLSRARKSVINLMPSHIQEHCKLKLQEEDKKNV